MFPNRARGYLCTQTETTKCLKRESNREDGVTWRALSGDCAESPRLRFFQRESSAQIPLDQFQNTDDQNHGERQPPTEIDGVLVNRPQIFIPRRRITERKYDHNGNCCKYHWRNTGGRKPPALFLLFTLVPVVAVPPLLWDFCQGTGRSQSSKQ